MLCRKFLVQVNLVDATAVAVHKLLGRLQAPAIVVGSAASAFHATDASSGIVLVLSHSSSLQTEIVEFAVPKQVALESLGFVGRFPNPLTSVVLPSTVDFDIALKAGTVSCSVQLLFRCGLLGFHKAVLSVVTTYRMAKPLSHTSKHIF